MRLNSMFDIVQLDSDMLYRPQRNGSFVYDLEIPGNKVSQHIQAGVVPIGETTLHVMTHAVTNHLWDLICPELDARTRTDYYARFENEQLNMESHAPVICINIDDCIKFIDRINQMMQLRIPYEWRLPTLTEWQIAADQMPTTRHGVLVAANFAEWWNNGRFSHPVRGNSFEPNKYGLFCMWGNVSEWINGNPNHYICGGSYCTPASLACNIQALDSSQRYPYVGFRLVRNIFI